YDFHIFGDELPAFDIFDEFRLDLVRKDLANACMLVDVGPLRDQEEALRILGIATENPILHLRFRLVHGIAIRVVELLERLDELFLMPPLHAEIIDMQVVALAGVPVCVKDILDVAGLPTCWGSRLMAQASPAKSDIAAVARLRAAGAVVIGKSTTTEFAHSPLGFSPLTGLTRNPWAPELTCG